MVGPMGTASDTFISSFLFEGNILTRRLSPSLYQLITSLILAFTVASVSLVTLAFSKSKTQTSTPFLVVLVTAILLWSGDQLKLDSLGFSGRPLTSVAILLFGDLIFMLL